MKTVIVSLALLCVFCWASCEPVPKGETIMDVAAKALQMLKDLCDEGVANSGFQKLVELCVGAYLKNDSETNYMELQKALLGSIDFMSRGCKLPSEVHHTLSKLKFVAQKF